MRRTFVALLLAGLLASGAMAEQWYARGDFNGWGESAPMSETFAGSGVYSAAVDISTQTPGSYFEFKVATVDWAQNYPTDNIKTKYPALSAMNFYFTPAPAADGWNPAANRVGYQDAGTGWEIMGAFNGWSVPAVTLNSMGNGLYAGDLLVPLAGSYDFKFRGTNDWEVSVGQHFGRFAPNANVTTALDNQTVRFELDLPGGRWRTSIVPEPASIAGLALLGLLIRRR
jgi:hypothetical protein